MTRFIVIVMKTSQVSWFLSYWGNVTCCAYILPQLDTIDTKTGGIDKDSTLNVVVFGVKTKKPKFYFNSNNSI